MRLQRGDAGIVDERRTAQLLELALEGFGGHEPLCGGAARIFRDGGDVQVQVIQREAARRAVGAGLRRVQRIHSHHTRAARGAELDERAQVAEVADAPVSLRAQAVELDGEAPDAAALREELRLVAASRLELYLGRLALGAERALQRLARLGINALLVPPDVEIALRDFRIRSQDRNYSEGIAAFTERGKRSRAALNCVEQIPEGK